MMRPLSATLAAGVLCCAISATACAAAREDDLAAWAPASSLFFLEIRNPKGISEKVEQARILERFAETRLGKIVDAHGKYWQWLDIRDAVLNATGTDLKQAIRNAFGDAAAISGNLRPRPKGEAWLLALRAVMPGENQRLLRMVWDGDRNEGKITDFHEEPRDGMAVIRIRRATGKVGHHALSERLFLGADSQKTIIAAIDAAFGRAPSLAQAPRFAAARNELGRGDLFAYLDIRRLAARIPAPRSPKEPLAALLSALRTGAADHLALRGTLVENRLVLDFRLTLNRAHLPEPLAAVIAQPPRPSKIARLLPPDATAAQIVMRTPIKQRFDLVRWLAGPAGAPGCRLAAKMFQNVFGGMSLKEISAMLGPETGFVVLPGPKTGDTVPHAALLIEASHDPHFRGRVIGILDMLFTALAGDAIKQARGGTPRVELAHQGIGGAPAGVMTIRGPGLPRALNPCYGFAGDFLVFASSPDAMRAIRDAAANPRPTADPTAEARVLHINGPRLIAVAAQMIRALKPRTSKPGPAGRESASSRNWKRFKKRFEIAREVLAPLRTLTIHTRSSADKIRVRIEIAVDWTAWPLQPRQGDAPPPPW